MEDGEKPSGIPRSVVGRDKLLELKPDDRTTVIDKLCTNLLDPRRAQVLGSQVPRMFSAINLLEGGYWAGSLTDKKNIVDAIRQVVIGTNPNQRKEKAPDVLTAIAEKVGLLLWYDARCQSGTTVLCADTVVFPLQADHRKSFFEIMNHLANDRNTPTLPKDISRLILKRLAINPASYRYLFQDPVRFYGLDPSMVKDSLYLNPKLMGKLNKPNLIEFTAMMVGPAITRVQKLGEELQRIYMTPERENK